VAGLVIREVLTEYLEALNQNDVTRAASHCAPPITMILGDRVVTASTVPEIVIAYTTMLAALRARGCARSEWTDIYVHNLANNLALASGRATRYKTDGSVLEHIGATYLMRKVGGLWKLSVLTAHDPDAIIPHRTGCAPDSPREEMR
jgi:ketosteroid isomerase-like protein